MTILILMGAISKYLNRRLDRKIQLAHITYLMSTSQNAYRENTQNSKRYSTIS